MKRNISIRGAIRKPFGPVIALAAGLLLSLGCSGSDRPKTVAVSGSVTVKGEAPSYPGGVFFAPIEVEEGYPKRGGRALFETDGEFSVTTFEDGDGLIPGTYRVRVESWKVPPSMGKPGVSYIPKGFEADDLVVSSKDKKVALDIELMP